MAGYNVLSQTLIPNDAINNYYQVKKTPSNQRLWLGIEDWCRLRRPTQDCHSTTDPQAVHSQIALFYLIIYLMFVFFVITWVREENFKIITSESTASFCPCIWLISGLYLTSYILYPSLKCINAMPMSWCQCQEGEQCSYLVRGIKTSLSFIYLNNEGMQLLK